MAIPPASWGYLALLVVVLGGSPVWHVIYLRGKHHGRHLEGRCSRSEMLAPHGVLAFSVFCHLHVVSTKVVVSIIPSSTCRWLVGCFDVLIEVDLYCCSPYMLQKQRGSPGCNKVCSNMHLSLTSATIVFHGQSSLCVAKQEYQLT